MVEDVEVAARTERPGRRVGFEVAPSALEALKALVADGTLTTSGEDAVDGAVEAIELLTAQVAQLLEALESRIIIEQAKGILMASGATPDEAFEMLRRASQRRNQKLRVIADSVIYARGLGAPKDSQGLFRD